MAARTSASDAPFTVWGFHVNRAAPQLGIAHRHNEIEMNFVRRGWVRMIAGGGVHQFEPGHLILYWASRPHQALDASPDAQWDIVTIPLAWFMQWNLPKDFVRQAFHGRVFVESDENWMKHDGVAMERWSQDVRSNDPRRREMAIAEIQCRLHRLAASVGDDFASGVASPTASAAVSKNKVEQVTTLIAERYVEPLSVTDIAEAVHLSPRYLTTMFRRSCGMGIVDVIWQHRVHHAERLLLTTELKTIDVAEQAGFGSLSQFHAVFRRLCQTTPRAYRAAHRVERRAKDK